MQAESQNGLPHYKLLVVDDDDIIRGSIVNYLEQHHEAPYVLEIDASCDAPDAKAMISQKTYDLVLSDINLPTDDGFSILEHVQEVSPTTKTALITAYKVEDYIRMAKKTGVFNIIAKTAPFNFQELSTMINNLLIPGSAFNLANYMGPDAEITEMTITCSDQIMDVFYALRTFFSEANAKHVDDLSTAMIEALTNSVYHVAKLSDGSLKYQKGQFIEKLDPEEYVFVTFGKDKERVGVSISDQGGRITADEILYWLDRNISGSGLLDTHGRGVYLIHTLVDRLVINISPGKRTEIIVLDYFSNEFCSNRPLYINQM